MEATTSRVPIRSVLRNRFIRSHDLILEASVQLEISWRHSFISRYHSPRANCKGEKSAHHDNIHHVQRREERAIERLYASTCVVICRECQTARHRVWLLHYCFYLLFNMMLLIVIFYELSGLYHTSFFIQVQLWNFKNTSFGNWYVRFGILAALFLIRFRIRYWYRVDELSMSESRHLAPQLLWQCLLSMLWCATVQLL